MLWISIDICTWCWWFVVSFVTSFIFKTHGIIGVVEWIDSITGVGDSIDSIVGVVDSIDGIVGSGDSIDGIIDVGDIIDSIVGVSDDIAGIIGVIDGLGALSGVGIGLDGIGASWGVTDTKSSTSNLFVVSHLISFVDFSLCPASWLYVTMDES